MKINVVTGGELEYRRVDETGGFCGDAGQELSLVATKYAYFLLGLVRLQGRRVKC